jgi:hypothetical protein
MTLDLTPGVQDLALKIFDVLRASDPRIDVCASYRVLIGSAAHLALTVEAPQQPMIVGRHFLGGTDEAIEARGYVDRYYVLGIPVHEDREGPLWQWRVVDEGGLTITWGEWPQPPTPGGTTPPT